MSIQRTMLRAKTKLNWTTEKWNEIEAVGKTIIQRNIDKKLKRANKNEQ